MNRNNLGKGCYNTFWKISRGFKVLMLVGYLDEPVRDSLCRRTPVYEEVKTKAGDQIHDLHGGVILFKKDKDNGHRITMKLEDKEQMFPEKSLKRISQEDAIKASTYTNGEAYNLLSEDHIKKKGLFLGPI